MKKLILAMGITLSALSCSDRNEEIVADTAVQTTSTSNASYAGKRDPNVAVMATFDFYLGRKSKDCNGFGVCGLAAFGIDIIELPTPPKGQHRGSVVVNEKGGIEGEILMDEKPLGDDITFYIEDDIEGVDRNGDVYILKQGSYEYDSTLGEFGGYTIDVVKI